MCSQEFDKLVVTRKVSLTFGKQTVRIMDDDNVRFDDIFTSSETKFLSSSMYSWAMDVVK